MVGFIFFFTLGFAWQPNNLNPNYSKHKEHPLYTQRKKHLLGVYSIDTTKSNAALDIGGLKEQKHHLGEKQFSVGIQSGYILDSYNKILTNLEHHLKKNGFAYQLLMLDYAFTPRLLNSRNWRLLLGVNAEMALGQLNNGNFVINGSALEKLSYTGFTYGIKSGLIHTFSKGELELGVQTRRLNFKQKHTSLNLNDNSSSVNLNLDKT